MTVSKDPAPSGPAATVAALVRLQVAARGLVYAETEAAKADGDLNADPTEATHALSTAAYEYVAALRAEARE
ncbi:hypothetical protein [Dietzia cinnamea]|uniref:hypothetical protein n=1 Tax=Dietzia cinnamea TaxID=321318 RepID=UPI000D6182B1|nr:hypothetical protein [Dietzia cinnamea]MBM7231937.1 hypothetical protein [Dietzia cinnamea]MCT1641281.1 hypothetical protein [Dietzia cinnamea]PWD94869.1 hypothetical protein DEQ16_13780 [Dietzia maris]